MSTKASCVVIGVVKTGNCVALLFIVFKTESVVKRLILGMGTNTENGIRIFGITIRIYLSIHFSVGSGDPFSVWHRTYPDTGTVQDQFELWIVRSSVSIIYLELGSLFMLNCFLTTCNSRRRPSICKFKFRSVCITCESRCQHESIDSIVKTESSSNRTICGQALIKEFLFTITFQQTAKFLDFVHMTN